MLFKAQFTRYLVVGGLIGFFFIGFSTFFINFFHLSSSSAVLASYVITFPISFGFQKHVTFRSRGKWLKQFFLFSTVTLGLILYNSVTSIVFPIFSKSVFSIFINWVFISLINYFFYRKIFR